jgi:(p)ppGpp synthase/HD superfamily hydrolase
MNLLFVLYKNTIITHKKCRQNGDNPYGQNKQFSYIENKVDKMYNQPMSTLHEAIIFASRKHDIQKRKGTNIPYFSHCAEVMQILTANGCSEKTIIAGVLHDVLEDTETSPYELTEKFGKEVFDIVNAESEDKSLPWKERKQATITHMTSAPLEVKQVCCADKLANLRSIAADLKSIGEELWERFNAPKKDIEWYYNGLFAALADLSSYLMYGELKEVLEEVFVTGKAAVEQVEVDEMGGIDGF